MNAEEFLKSIYFGDRACKALLIDSWKKRVAIQVDVISRLRPGAKTWDFHTDADIKDGWLVFTGVRTVRFEPSGPLPNDLINDISVKPINAPQGESAYLFELSIGSVGDTGDSTEVWVRIEASGVHLEEMENPGVEI